MKQQNEYIEKHSSSSYVVAVPDDLSLTKISDLKRLLKDILIELDKSQDEIDISQLSLTLDFFKSESDIWIESMSTYHWIIFAILQHYNLIIHEFTSDSKYGRIINILARGKQQRIERILSGQYL